ncbi:sulfur oxygenase reductase family protein [Rhabdochromatium marinum]|uniref:sulfur oxygenase reductase family protein n=1 Tax=Rhabdochromatium marinum TaxID=48729 RepID=UPI00308413D0|nr:hypothetical protein [Rhabdochromatium marinum]
MQIDNCQFRAEANACSAAPLPAEYITMVEFENMHYAQTSMPHVNVKPEILQVHGTKVLDNCLSKPTVRISDSMFSEHTYREILQGLR